MIEDINTEALGGTGDADVSSGTGSASETVSVKDVLSKALGKPFPDDAAAVKAVQDTFKFVGSAGKFKKAVEAIMSAKGMSEDDAVKFIQDSVKPESVDPSKFVSRQEFDEATFYGSHPEYKDHAELIDALRSKTGKSLSEVVALDSFKKVYEAAKAHSESEQAKSVLHTNPRLGAVADKVTQARDKESKGDHAGAVADAVSAVIDVYELEKKQ